MIDFWLDVMLATLVAIATGITDWLASRLVTATRRLAAIKRVTDQVISDETKLGEIERELARYYAAQETNLIWGSDLAAIAISLDLAVLGIWIYSPDFFPFFSRWNAPNVSREIPVWLILLFVHFVLLLLSILLKHIHTEIIEGIPTGEHAKMFQPGWFAQNRVMLGSNAVGFITLLSSFVIIGNAI